MSLFFYARSENVMNCNNCKYMKKIIETKNGDDSTGTCTYVGLPTRGAHVCENWEKK